MWGSRVGAFLKRPGVFGAITPCARAMTTPARNTASEINELIKLIAQDVRENGSTYRLIDSAASLSPQSSNYLEKLEELLALGQSKLLVLDLAPTSQMFDGIRYLMEILKQKDTSTATTCFQRAALEAVKTFGDTLKRLDRSTLKGHELSTYDWLIKETESLLKEHNHLLVAKPAHDKSSPELK